MAELYGRRKFITDVTKAAGATMVVTLPASVKQKNCCKQKKYLR
jgi:hypothetical protein